LKRTRVEVETAMSNAVEARKVVFELFQDLDGFRLDDYKAMGNPQEGMDILIQLVADASSCEGDTFTSRGDKMFGWVGKDAESEVLLTAERQLSLSRENVQLLGLDHPIVSAYLRKFRELSPQDVGIRVQSPDGTQGVLAAWAVEARGDKGQLTRMIVTLGIDGEGRRHVPWERQPERIWRSAVSADKGSRGDSKITILRDTLEPMLQRELEHRGLGRASRGFEAKLIGWVEVVGL
jgi:hypothetical protein